MHVHEGNNIGPRSAFGLLRTNYFSAFFGIGLWRGTLNALHLLHGSWTFLGCHGHLEGNAVVSCEVIGRIKARDHQFGAPVLVKKTIRSEQADLQHEH